MTLSLIDQGRLEIELRAVLENSATGHTESTAELIVVCTMHLAKNVEAALDALESRVKELEARDNDARETR